MTSKTIPSSPRKLVCLVADLGLEESSPCPILSQSTSFNLTGSPPSPSYAERRSTLQIHFDTQTTTHWEEVEELNNPPPSNNCAPSLVIHQTLQHQTQQRQTVRQHRERLQQGQQIRHRKKMERIQGKQQEVSERRKETEQEIHIQQQHYQKKLISRIQQQRKVHRKRHHIKQKSQTELNQVQESQHAVSLQRAQERKMEVQWRKQQLHQDPQFVDLLTSLHSST